MNRTGWNRQEAIACCRAMKRSGDPTVVRDEGTIGRWDEAIEMSHPF